MSQRIFLNEGEVAEMLGYSVQTMRNKRWLKTNRIPFYRDGRNIRYDRDDVIGYMKSKRVFPDKC